MYRYNYRPIWNILQLTCSSWSCLCIPCLLPNAGCELGSLTACRPHMLYPWQMVVPCNNAHRSSWWPGAFHGLLPSPRGRYHMGNTYHSKETWNWYDQSYIIPVLWWCNFAKMKQIGCFLFKLKMILLNNLLFNFIYYVVGIFYFDVVCFEF